jgi:4-diphosphocytidyl-2-C-methyl-D-erythritol kinase
VPSKSTITSRQSGLQKNQKRKDAVKAAVPRDLVEVVVPSFAKLNLDLRVLHRRSDGFHELRTIFQTISLCDRLKIQFKRAKQTSIELDSTVELEDNIILKAARAVLEYMDVSAHVRFSLEKNIPIGAGLGGGSSNAATVLVSLPALAGKRLNGKVLQRLASWLGSDVPFFLYGGTALGLGRGTELYPLPDLDAHYGVVMPGGIHISTAEAYAGLGRPRLLTDDGSVNDSLTSDDGFPILGEFQAVAWALASLPLSEVGLQNDFEAAVLAKHPALVKMTQQLRRHGANPVRMSGSGSAFFGLTENLAQAKEIARDLSGAIPIKFVTRRDYRNQWADALGPAAAFSVLCQK